MSDAGDNGGIAFPHPSGAPGYDGMSLLDYFACAAMTSELLVQSDSTRIAVKAYEQATAMIAEKRRRETTI